MTRVVFTERGGVITAFSVKGHSGSAPYGRDIVCSAVSSAVGYAMLLLKNLGGESFLSEIDGGNALVLARLAGELPERREAGLIVGGLRRHLLEISRDYPGNVAVMTVKTGG